MSTARLGVVAGVVAALAWSGFLLDLWIGPPGFTTRGFVSELDAPGAPGEAVFRAADLVAGVALVVLGACLVRLRTGLRRELVAGLLVAATGVGALLDGTVGMSCAGLAAGECADGARTVDGMLGALADVHTLSAVLAFLGTGLGPVLLGSALGQRGRPVWGWASVACGVVVALCGLADLVLLLVGADVGVLERVRTVITSLWLAAAGAQLLTRPPARLGAARRGVLT